MTRPKVLDMDILDSIVRVQQRHPELIRPVLEVHEEYELSKAFRRGSKSEDQNRCFKDGDIDRNNR